MCDSSDAKLCMCQHEQTNSDGHAEHKLGEAGDGVHYSYLFLFSCLIKDLQFLHCLRVIKTMIMFHSFDS